LKVSIITISYNSVETIEDTIKSVIAQSYPNIEYILIDGASSDGTQTIISKYERAIAVYTSEKDEGIYDAMNKGVAAATGDIIGILNSDDIYADTKVIQDVVDQFQKTNCMGCYADLEYVDRENTEKVIRYWKAGDYSPGIFRKGWMPPHPTFFVSRKVYEDFGSYNTELRSAADYEFMLRVIHKNEIAVSYLPRVVTLMRVGGQSNVTLANRIKANKEDRRAWEMNGLKPGTLTLVRKPLSKFTQFIKRK
jgi:glycosyltransferase involved in cell wall biosynthesis